MCQLGTKNIVTKLISEVNFMAPAYQGDIVEIGVDVKSFGRTSIILEVDARNKDTEESILKIDKIIFVSLDEEELGLKIDSLSKYQSQSHRVYATEEFIKSLAITRGVQIGKNYAECFEVVRWVVN